MSRQQIVEKSFSFESWFGQEQLLDLGPDIDKGIEARSVLPRLLSLRRKCLVVAIGSCCFLVHRSHPGRGGE